MKKLLSVMLIAITMFTYACKSQAEKDLEYNTKVFNQLGKAYGINLGAYPQTKQQRTPKGAFVNSNHNMTPEEEAEYFALIDESLSEMFAKEPTMTNHTTHAEYVFVLVPSERESVEEGKCPLILKTDGNTYIGQVIGFGVVSPPVIAMPDKYKINPNCRQLFKNGVNNEGEHVRLFFNNFKLFEYFQGARDQHPLLEQVEALRNDPQYAYLFQ